MSVKVCVEFSGGAELLFDNAKSIELNLAECRGGDDGAGAWNVAKLIAYLKENLLRERPELFVKDGTVRYVQFAPPICQISNQMKKILSKLKCPIFSDPGSWC